MDRRALCGWATELFEKLTIGFKKVIFVQKLAHSGRDVCLFLPCFGKGLKSGKKLRFSDATTYIYW